jgi:antitoxin YefM
MLSTTLKERTAKLVQKFVQKEHFMTVVNYTEARNNLKSILDSVVDDADYTIINRRDSADAVVMSLDYFNSMQETLHLLKSPKNVKHLEKSIEQYHDSKTKTHSLIDE